MYISQTNFTAAGMSVYSEDGVLLSKTTVADSDSVVEVVEEKKVTAKPVAKKVEAKVEEVQPEVVVEPVVEVVAEEVPEVK
jgi:hypothetical protein